MWKPPDGFLKTIRCSCKVTRRQLTKTTSLSRLCDFSTRRYFRKNPPRLNVLVLKPPRSFCVGTGLLRHLYHQLHYNLATQFVFTWSEYEVFIWPVNMSADWKHNFVGPFWRSPRESPLSLLSLRFASSRFGEREFQTALKKARFHTERARWFLVLKQFA